MRVLLFTGKGGVGKTTWAAATAVQLAAGGHKTLLVSTDSSRSLADVCGVAVGPQPTETVAGLYVAQIETQRAFERSWEQVQSYLGSVLGAAGADPLDAAEVATFAGADELLALLEVANQAASGRWDAIVVDCGTATQTLRMLSLPGTFTWYLERLLPLRRRGLRGAPVRMAAAAGTRDSRARVFEAIVQLHAGLLDVTKLLVDAETTSVRLVLTPQAVVVADARRTLTALSLHGYPVDEVIVNRVCNSQESDLSMGAGSSGALAEQSALALIEQSFAPRAIRLAPILAVEPVGFEALGILGRRVYADADPLALTPAAAALQVDQAAGTFKLSLALPLVERDEIDLVRRGDDLVVTVQGQRRVLTLPSALRRCVITGAALAGGRLGVDFVPDPDLWMRS